ncbi:hypothetical protein [Adhaeribacter radiodurans]|uniref:Tetratricopeptide repeat protein n=1 Tax=Adhaeribacter radiodurans TaxID=2745197 RepID=A0A7L7L7E4_9BACT|nr:hypothetical protein [Adhaeribacter radiodurans]QMU28279.1 hypothetical protein HUW48_09640 [Adhaeribacter radiodurans]
MNKSALLQMMNHVSALSDQDVEELEKLVKNFPYCQTAHLLIAKASLDKGSMLSNQKLRKAAAYATNRHLLKKLIYTSDAAVSLAAINEQEYTETQTEKPVLNNSNHLIEPDDTEQNQVGAPISEDEVEVAEPAPESTTANSALATNSLSISPEEKDHTESVEIIILPDEEVTEIENSEIVLDEVESIPYSPELETTLPNDLPVVEEPPLSVPEIEAVTPLQPTTSFTKDEVDELLQVEKWKINTSSSPKENPVEINNNGSEQDLESTPITQEPAEIIRYELEVPEEPEEGTLNQTLANFDTYLFQPEQDEYLPGELKAATNEEFIRDVFLSNQVGYWMGSSRLGELLQVKDEVTRHTPLQFYPDLILEYSKQNYLTPTDPPKITPVGRQFEIIDQFLKANPKLKTFSNEKLRTEPQDDLAFKSTKNTKNLASENLATILIKQGKLKKAIKIYEHLIVKIPEKKAYFASQIENLRNQL